jgi:nucleotide-binding universal stress UspA family protein
MIELRRILVPTDFSETSAAAMRYGVELARRFHARLYLLHVVENPGEAAEIEFPIGLFDTMHNAAHDRLRQLIPADVVKELEPHCAMRIGNGADEIVRHAQDHDIDLIVMGTHGREGVARMIIGSVAEKVVRRAVCPVLTVHHPEHEFLVDPATIGDAAYAAN